jgi:hypothetical protein
MPESDGAFPDLAALFGEGRPSTPAADPAAVATPAPSAPKTEDLVAEQGRRIAELSEKLEAANATAKETLDFKEGMRALFDPNGKSDAQAKADRELADRILLAKDPLKFYAEREQAIESRIQKMIDERIQASVEPLRAEGVTRKAIDYVTQRYPDVDFESPGVQQKVLAELEKLDARYKQKEPGKALLHAAYLANVLGERREGGRPNHVEAGDGMSSVVRKQMTEGEEIQRRVRERAAARNAGVLATA